jgi:hypothetical protein
VITAPLAAVTSSLSLRCCLPYTEFLTLLLLAVILPLLVHVVWLLRYPRRLSMSLATCRPTSRFELHSPSNRAFLCGCRLPEQSLTASSPSVQEVTRTRDSRYGCTSSVCVTTCACVLLYMCVIVSMHVYAYALVTLYVHVSVPQLFDCTPAISCAVSSQGYINITLTKSSDGSELLTLLPSPDASPAPAGMQHVQQCVYA